MRCLVTGGAGFLGSHLCNRLISDGNAVICLDNFHTGDKRRIAHLMQSDKFSLLTWNITEPIHVDVDCIYNFASPAAPADYNRDKEYTITTNVLGARNVLFLAKKLNIPILQASTVRVLDTNGNGNPYITGKIEAEQMLLDYPKSKIARLHSTFGSGMSLNDSRVIPSFFRKAKAGEPLIVYDNRLDQFCHVDDMVDEIVSFMNSDQFGIRVLGNPYKISILDLANLIIRVTQSKSKVDFASNNVII